MNPTPCPECNFIAWCILNAWLNHDRKDIRYWHQKRDEHQETCPIVNGGWYLGLWPNAKVSK